jgi:A/G-specific adenine glycosylase
MLELSLVHTALFSWWRQHGRVLPWREKLAAPQTSVRSESFNHYFASSLKRDPYKVVVAEMMLQQTQVDRVMPKFLAWMAKWPTTADLAKATLAEVLISWQGLGYNRRAKFLWQLAQKIEELDGVWSTTEVELLGLPGIGKYTARAIMSFAFGMQVGVVDTNIKRVIARTQGIEWSEKQVNPPIDLKADYFLLADQMLPVGQADPWNQGIMDLGAMVCTASSPKCEICPISSYCESNLRAQAHGWENYAAWLKSLPKKPRGAKKTIRFEDTDRFFRGRIMDLLRADSFKVIELARKMEDEYGLIDHDRFQKLVSGLVEEEMISTHGDIVRLGH